MSRFTSLAYAELAVGRLQTVAHVVDAGFVARWRALVGYPDGSRVPSSLALTWLLEALREALHGIPAGGVLLRHELAFAAEPPVPAELESTVFVAERSERRGRPVVVFALDSSADGTPIVSDRMELIWPSQVPAGPRQQGSGPMVADAPEEVLQRLTITQADIDAYAELSGDYNPLHVDVEVGRRSPFGSTIAHGPLPLAFVQRAIERERGGVWPFGLQLDARFLSPTRPGDELEVQRVADDAYRLVDTTGRLLVRVQVTS